MTDVFIEKTNASFLTLYIEDEGIDQHIYDYFRYNQPKFTANKWSKWDGVVRMYNKKSKRLPCGILNILLKFLKENQYSYEVDSALKDDIVKNLTKEQIVEWVSTIDIRADGEKIEPYDYQLEALYLALKYNRLTLLAATSAGKSLIIYLMNRFYDEIGYDSGKTLIIVPTIGLVSQLYKDFQDYSSHNGYDVQSNVHCIAEGAVRVSRKPIHISTWQSLQDLEADHFHQFARVIIDECHLASGKTITTIANSCINANTRVGLTGTLKGTELHDLQVGGLLGPIVRIVTTKQLQDAGRAALTNVTMMNLEYSTEERRLVSNMNWQEEVDFIMAHEYRNNIIRKLAISLSGNSLFMFNRREKHLDMLYNELVAMNLPNKKFFIIAGGVSSEEKDEIRRLTDASEAGIDVVIFAIDKSASTGMSIKKLHNLVLCFSTKSIITVLQSIGRMLRLHKDKTLSHIFDLVDNLEYSGEKNHSLRHAMDRYGFYKMEEHPIEVRKYIMEPNKIEE